jgi:hypothetical protein
MAESQLGPAPSPLPPLEKGKASESDPLIDGTVGSAKKKKKTWLVFAFRRFRRGGRDNLRRPSPCAMLGMLVSAAALPLLAVVVFVLALLAGASSTSAHFIVVSLFLLAAQVPLVTGILLALCHHMPRMGLVHTATVACVSGLLACGLLTNSRVMQASELSEYCESHGIFHGHCEWTQDASTGITLGLIAVVLIVGAIACTTSWKIYRIARDAKASGKPLPVID